MSRGSAYAATPWPWLCACGAGPITRVEVAGHLRAGRPLPASPARAAWPTGSWSLPSPQPPWSPPSWASTNRRRWKDRGYEPHHWSARRTTSDPEQAFIGGSDQTCNVGR